MKNDGCETRLGITFPTTEREVPHVNDERWRRPPSSYYHLRTLTSWWRTDPQNVKRFGSHGSWTWLTDRQTHR